MSLIFLLVGYRLINDLFDRGYLRAKNFKLFCDLFYAIFSIIKKKVKVNLNSMIDRNHFFSSNSNFCKRNQCDKTIANLQI